MSIAVVATATGTTVLLHGPIDMASRRVLSEALEQACSAAAGDVSVDLGRVDFMDSTGLSLLLRARKTLAAAGCTLHVINANPKLMRVFLITGLQDHLNVKPLRVGDDPAD